MSDGLIVIDDESAIQIINVSGSGLACILSLIVGILTLTKMRESKGAAKVKAMFILSFCLAVLGTAAWTIVFALDHDPRGIDAGASAHIVSIASFCWSFFVLTLLGTLVLRLHVTFKGTAMAMSRNTVRFFVIMFVTEVIICIVWTVSAAVYNMQLDAAVSAVAGVCATLGLILFIILYIIASLAAVRLFVLNLSELTRLQATSHHELPELSVSPDFKTKDISLNAKQQKTLHLSARYILLFFVAISSTILSYFLMVILSTHMVGIIWSIDLCVNVWCLYLQFAFAANHYRKCCGCLDSCCRSMVLNGAKRAIHKEFVTNRMAMSNVSGSMDKNTV